MPMKRLLIMVLLVLTLAVLACDVNPPAWTPSPPQMTAGALNATYEAQATSAAGTLASTAAAPTPTPGTP
jgi:hypothetical protein